MATPSMFRQGKPKQLVNWVRGQATANGAVKFRCETDEGSTVVALSAKGGIAQHARTAKAILSLGTLKVEALDKHGDTVDVFRLVDPNADPENPGAEAYAKSPDDTPDERVLKTFGQLLAAAHNAASRQLVETVQMMGTHYAQERQAMRGQAEALERLNNKLARRVRVATDPEDGEGEGEGNFLESFIGDMVRQKMAAGMAEAVTAPAREKVNGTGGKTDA